MKTNKLLPVLTLILMSLSTVAQDISILTTNKHNDSNKYIFIASNNPNISPLVDSFSEDKSYVVFRDSLSNTSPVIIANSSEFFERERAGKDLLIGVGTCLTSLLFVQCLGQSSENNPPEDGTLYVYVGDKYIQGAPAIIPLAGAATGCLFGLRGIIELFQPRSNRRYGFNNNSVEEILKKTGLLVSEEKTFNTTASLNDMEQYIKLQLH